MVFAHVHQCASSARGVRPRVGVALSWGYAQAGQRGGRWQLRSVAVSSASVSRHSRHAGQDFVVGTIM